MTQKESKLITRLKKTRFLTFRNKIKGLEQEFRNNQKIVQELGTKIKD